MALTTTTYSIPLTYKVTTDTALTNAAVLNLTGTGGSIYHIEIVNGNAHHVYVKMFNSADVTVGTTIPYAIFRARNNETLSVEIPTGLNFGSAISMVCTQTAGVPGTTAPSAAITVRLMTT